MWLFAPDHLHDVITGRGRPRDLVDTQRVSRNEAVSGEEAVEVGHAASHLRPARGAGREQRDEQHDCR